MTPAPALSLPDVDPTVVVEVEHFLGVQQIVTVDGARRISILPAADSEHRAVQMTDGQTGALIDGEAGVLFPPLPGHRDVAVLDEHGIVGDGELWHITDDEARAVVARVLAGNLTDFGVDA